MRNLKIAGLPVVAFTGLLLMPIPEAAAHEVVYTDYRGRPATHVVHRRAVMPPWLRHHRDFTAWYSLNYGYRAVNIGWQRLYRQYEGDYYYHRNYKPRHAARYKAKKYKAKHYKAKQYKAKYGKRHKRDNRRQR